MSLSYTIFWNIIGYFPKFKETTWPWRHQLGKPFVTSTTNTSVAYQCTEFEVSSISHFRDIEGSSGRWGWGSEWLSAHSPPPGPGSSDISDFPVSCLDGGLGLVFSGYPELMTPVFCIQSMSGHAPKERGIPQNSGGTNVSPWGSNVNFWPLVGLYSRRS